MISTAALLWLAACSGASPGQAPLAGAAIGGPFALTDQDGRTVTDKDFAGRYRIVYFGYSFCPDVCPTDLQAIGQGLKRLEKDDPARAARIQPIFITVDPERDSPAVLKRYVAAFHPRLVGLTGSAQQIADVARRYGVSYSAEKAQGGAGYAVAHSRTSYLFGPDGRPIALLPSDNGADAVAAELRKWVR
jgi:protein SCO1/2